MEASIKGEYVEYLSHHHNHIHQVTNSHFDPASLPLATSNDPIPPDIGKHLAIWELLKIVASDTTKKILRTSQTKGSPIS